MVEIMQQWMLGIRFEPQMDADERFDGNRNLCGAMRAKQRKQKVLFAPVPPNKIVTKFILLDSVARFRLNFVYQALPGLDLVHRRFSILKMLHHGLCCYHLIGRSCQ
jgi:hypothetical protein